MKKLLPLAIAGYQYFGSLSIANAHVGHLGELAGHSHWIGLGAIVVAGAIAAAVGKLRDDSEDSKDAPESEPTEETA